MFWTLLILAAAAALGVVLVIYRVRAAWSPFGSRGRRRVVFWARGWWRGEQAQNRDSR